jgi:hypothetical protein
MTDPFKNQLNFFKDFKENESDLNQRSVDANLKFNRIETHNQNLLKPHEALRSHRHQNSELVNQLKSNFELLFKAAG